MMIIEQYEARSAQPLAAGKHKIVVETAIAGPGKVGAVVLKVDGAEVGQFEKINIQIASDRRSAMHRVRFAKWPVKRKPNKTKA